MIVALVLSIAFPVCFVVLLIGCLDCLVRKRRLEGFRSRDATDGRHTNAFSVDICDVPNTSEQVTIEPLPDILSKVSVAPPLRPQITFIERGEHASTAPLISVQRSFPRDQLTYLNEIGSGWFGKAIESEAIQIVGGSQKSHVVVKMLKDDASKQEQKQFLDEVHAYRCLDHANLMSLLGQCTEAAPFLVILEFAVHGSLKGFLAQHSQDLEILVTKNRYISLALDAAAGLACLHRHDYIHNDFAARNCLVMSDYTLKIGDYGISDTLFKNEYYNTGTELLPVRWMAPETLVKSDGVWTTQPHNKMSDMWSFGILLWEICSVGERPYDMLTDEAVLQGVIQDRLVLPSDVDIKLPFKDKLWSIMTQCWQDASSRLDVIQAYNSLEQLAKVRLDTTVEVMYDFDQKWNQLKANQEGVTHSKTDLGSRIALAGSFATDDSSSPPDKPSLLDGDAEARDSINSDDLIIDVGADDTFIPAYQSPAPVLANLINSAENTGQTTIQHKISRHPEDQVFVENEFTNTSVSQSHMTPIKSFDQTAGTTGTPILHNLSSSSGVSTPNSYNSGMQTTDIERHISPIFQEAKVKDFRSVNSDLSLDIEGHSLHKLTSTTQETLVKVFDSRMQTDDDFSDFVRTSPSAPSLDFTDFASADNSISAHVEHVQNDLQFGEVPGSGIHGNDTKTRGTVDNLVGTADGSSNVDNDIIFSDFVTSDPPNKPGSTEIIKVNLDTASNGKSPGLAESFIRQDTSKLDDNLVSSDDDSDAFSDFVSSVPARTVSITPDATLEAVTPDARIYARHEAVTPDAKLEAVTQDARLEAVTPDARLDAVTQDARLDAITPDARLEAVTQDARLEAVTQDARLDAVTPDARLEAVTQDARLEAVTQDARLDAVTPDARLDAITPDARLEAVTQDARLEAVTPYARLEAVTPDARLEAVTPDARLEAVTPDARLEAVTPDARLEAVTPDARLEAVTQDARLEAVTQDARLEAVTQDARLETVTQDARLEAVKPDARLDAITQDARLEAVTPDARLEAATPDARLEAITQDARLDAITDARLEAITQDARLDAVTQDARLEAITQYARLDAITDARLEAVTQDARLEAVTQDARLEAVTQDARLEAITQDARLDAITPDAKLEAVTQDARFEAVTPDARLEAVTPDAKLESSTLEGSDSKDAASLTHDLSLDMSFPKSGPEAHNETDNLSTPAPSSNKNVQVQGSLKDFEYDNSSITVDFDVEKTSLEKIEADHNQNIFSSEQFPSDLSSLASDMSFLIHDVNAAASNGILPVESKQQEASTDVQQKLSTSTSVEESHDAIKDVAAGFFDQGKPGPSYIVEESNISLESFEVLDGTFPSVAATSTDPAFDDVSEKKDDGAKEESGSHVQPSISFELLDSQLMQMTDTSSLSTPVENLGQMTDTSSLSTPVENLGKQSSSEATAAAASTSQYDLVGLNLIPQAVVSHAQEGDLLTDLYKPNGDAEQAEKSLIDF